MKKVLKNKWFWIIIIVVMILIIAVFNHSELLLEDNDISEIQIVHIYDALGKEIKFSDSIYLKRVEEISVIVNNFEKMSKFTLRKIETNCYSNTTDVEGVLIIITYKNDEIKEFCLYNIKGNGSKLRYKNNSHIYKIIDKKSKEFIQKYAIPIDGVEGEMINPKYE